MMKKKLLDFSTLCLAAGLSAVLATPRALAATITACVANEFGTVRIVA